MYRETHIYSIAQVRCPMDLTNIEACGSCLHLLHVIHFIVSNKVFANRQTYEQCLKPMLTQLGSVSQSLCKMQRFRVLNGAL